jgi:mitochondrial cardiolipin hydrolase
MDEIIAHLKASVADQFLSKTERRTLKDLLARQPLTAHDLNFLRSKVYEVANAHATPENYRFVLEWIKNTNSALLTAPAEVKMDAYFSPGEECMNVINQQIAGATQQLLICVFTISDDRITNTLLKAHEREQWDY